jgi:head-tail adaptor
VKPNAGNFSQQITIQRKQVVQDTVYGNEVITWVPLVAQAGSPTIAQRFWAEIQDVMPSRSESVKQGLNIASNQSRLRMRYRNDVDSTMRVIVHYETDVTYQIVGGPARVGGRKAMLEMVIERFSS